MALFRRYLVARTGPSEGRLTTRLRQPAERRLNSSSRPFPDICVRPQRAESAPLRKPDTLRICPKTPPRAWTLVNPCPSRSEARSSLRNRRASGECRFNEAWLCLLRLQFVPSTGPNRCVGRSIPWSPCRSRKTRTISTTTPSVSTTSACSNSSWTTCGPAGPSWFASTRYTGESTRRPSMR